MVSFTPSFIDLLGLNPNSSCKEVVSALLVLISVALVWLINPYVNQFIRENTSIYENIQESCRQFVEEKEETSGTDAGESQENAIENMTGLEVSVVNIRIASVDMGNNK